MNLLRICKIFVIAIAIFFSVNNGYSQEKENVRKKIEEIQSEIQYLNKLLESRESEKKNFINTINLVDKKIQFQEKYITSIESELKNLEKSIEEYKSIIDNLILKADELKKSYSRALQNYYFKRDKTIFWIYILAAENIVQSQRRYLYYRQYLKEIKYNAISINTLIFEIGIKKKEAEALIYQRKNLLKLKESEIKRLESDKKSKLMLLEKIKKEEGAIRKRIIEKKNIAAKLTAEMKRIIEEEIRRSKGKNAISLTKEEQIIAGNFEKNKGRLPWPVEKGIVIDRFGEHPHLFLKNVKVRNNGIDIETEKDSEVRTIYDGVVTKIVSILGAKFTVIIRHGNYLSVYQNIDEVFVKNGEKVFTGQKIGKIVTFKGEENSVLHFEIWKDFNRMDPEEWIKTK